MKKTNKLIIFLSLLLPIIIISYANVEQSISVAKFRYADYIGNLIKNYHLFLYSFKEFIVQTSCFHPGNAPAGWNTAYYLFPLFVFLKIAGGLSIKNTYLFTITTSLISLPLFYYWIKKYWGTRAALFSVFFLGYSAVFQDFARSGTYVSYSIMTAIIWIIYVYKYAGISKTLPYLFLGFLSALEMYGYCTLRSLLFMPLYIIFLNREQRKKRFFLFLLGFIIFFIPGIILMCIREFPYYKGQPIYMFLDKEHIFLKKEFAVSLQNNIHIFVNRILGGKQFIPDPYVSGNYFAHYLNRILVLPFFMGIVRALKCRNEQRFGLLLLLSLLIFVPPLFSSSNGFLEDRRSVLYIIPIYAFIGLGMQEINNYLRLIHHKISKQILYLAGISLITIVIASELLYTNRYIWSGQRDSGIVVFVKDINKMNIGENIYYLKPECRCQNNCTGHNLLIYKLCKGETETFDILKLALMDNGNIDPKIIEIEELEKLGYSQTGFYLVKSQSIPEREFGTLCKKNNLNSETLLLSPVTRLGARFKLLKLSRL